MEDIGPLTMSEPRPRQDRSARLQSHLAILSESALIQIAVPTLCAGEM